MTAAARTVLGSSTGSSEDAPVPATGEEQAGRSAVPVAEDVGVSSPRDTAVSMEHGVTEVHGRAEDLQSELFTPGSGERPAPDGYGDPERVVAAAEGARTSMEVSGGVPGGGAFSVNTDVISGIEGSLTGVAETVGGALAGLVPVTAELHLWSLTGQPSLAGAGALADLVSRDLLGQMAGLEVSAARLVLARQNYETVERALTSLLAGPVWGLPLYGVTRPLVRDCGRTLEDLDVALARAGIDSPHEFLERVQPWQYGLIIRGGGPRGTDALIRGPGLDDLMEGLLQYPVVSGGEASGSHTAPGAGAGTPGAGTDAPGPGAVASDPDGRTGGAASSAPRPLTLGQHARALAVGLLTAYGRSGKTTGGAGDPLRDAAGEEPGMLEAMLAPAAAAVLPASLAGIAWYTPYRNGRRLTPAEAFDRGVPAALRPALAPRALREARREVFTGVTPANAARHHMTGMPERPLPAGVRHAGAVPTTIAGTAAALKDAKNIVSGAGPDGAQVENSTVVVQKATDGNGRSAYSVVLTGTEKWEDSPGVHDLKGIGQGITAQPDAALTELPQAQRMAVQALQDAGIRPGDTVVLTGHSLGGIDAAGLAANRAFRERYDVAAVTTFGSPVGDFEIPEDTSVMAVEHVDDVVPTLDGVPNPDADHRSTVRVNTPYQDALTLKQGFSGIGAHEMYVYTVGAQGITDSRHPAVVAHEQRLADAVPHGPGTRTETYVYEGREEH
ncbi:lipase family protein [Kocuria marina]|uniref:lipase family protein n=1 Tax=Kocuria marina TaxID=223184 RepID=UPI0022E71307|nr:lipase family protein [Kocuria marina]